MSEEVVSEEIQTDEYIQELPAVAKKMYLPCRKCEVPRYFTVLAHKSERAAKLECEVCKVKKSFTIKKPKVVKKKSTRRKRVNIYDKMMQEVGPDNARSYNMRETFEANQAIDHSKFGLGFITEATALKVKVVFSDGEKELVHNRE